MAFVFLVGLALASAFSFAKAADMTPTQMIQSQLSPGKTIGNTTKTEFSAPLVAAAKKFREAVARLLTPRLIRIQNGGGKFFAASSRASGLTIVIKSQRRPQLRSTLCPMTRMG